MWSPRLFAFGHAACRVALAAIVIAGCTPATPALGRVETAGTSEQPREVNVIMRDYLFQPTPLTLVGGETVRFNIINGGLLPHEFVLGDRTVQEAWASAEAAATPPAPLTTAPPATVPPTVGGLRVHLASGEQASVLYEVPRGGELELACHIPGHVEQGMVGEVRRATVGEDAARSGGRRG